MNLVHPSDQCHLLHADPQKIQGIGEGFVPRMTDLEVVDEVLEVLFAASLISSFCSFSKSFFWLIVLLHLLSDGDH